MSLPLCLLDLAMFLTAGSSSSSSSLSVLSSSTSSISSSNSVSESKWLLSSTGLGTLTVRKCTQRFMYDEDKLHSRIIHHLNVFTKHFSLVLWTKLISVYTIHNIFTNISISIVNNNMNQDTTNRNFRIIGDSTFIDFIWNYYP